MLKRDSEFARQADSSTSLQTQIRSYRNRQARLRVNAEEGLLDQPRNAVVLMPNGVVITAC